MAHVRGAKIKLPFLTKEDVNILCSHASPRAPNKAHALNVADKWHCAYHGSRTSEVRRILDTFDLLPTGQFTHELLIINVVKINIGIHFFEAKAKLTKLRTSSPHQKTPQSSVTYTD